MYGITEAVYHAWLTARGIKLKPVRNILVSEAGIIYREQYWNPTAVNSICSLASISRSTTLRSTPVGRVD
nr:glycosyl hydrolase 108 family protein [Rhizobium sp. Leaf262]